MAHRNRWFTVLKNGWIFPWQTATNNQRVIGEETTRPLLMMWGMCGVPANESSTTREISRAAPFVSAKRLANDYKKPQTCPLRLILQSLYIYIFTHIYIYNYIYLYNFVYTYTYIYRIYEIESNGYTNPFLTQNCSCNILQ